MFSKCAKFYVDWKNAIKIPEMFTVFEIMALRHDSRISVNYDENPCQPQSKVLPNSPKISHLTKIDVF